MADDEQVVLDIISAATDITTAVSMRTLDEFLEDWIVNAAVIQRLLVIGEAAKQLSREFWSAHPEIDWSGISRMRDKLVHHYRRVDLQEVWEMATIDVPALRAVLESGLPEQED